jgi:small nuclear ribonucleoprotein (snRNP)-like protein
MHGEESDCRENVALVRGLLLRRMRVVLVDGRVVEGILECVDYLRNLILRDAVDISGPHSLGLVLVPGKAFISAQVRRTGKLDGRPDGEELSDACNNQDESTDQKSTSSPHDIPLGVL